MNSKLSQENAGHKTAKDRYAESVNCLSTKGGPGWAAAPLSSGSGPGSKADLFDDRTNDMPDGDVRFLDALGVAGWHPQQQVHLSGQRPARFASQCDQERAAPCPGFR